MRARLTHRELGPITIVSLVIVLGALWALARPAGLAITNFLGQLLGAEAVLLMSIGLVLISTLPWVEEYFDGIDRAAIWHRRVAMTGLLLLAPHIVLATGRGSTLGVPLAVIGALGLLTLVVWAILPRWRSVIPAPLRGLVVRAREHSPLRHLRGRFGGYKRWRALHRTTGLFVAFGFIHGVLDGTALSDAPVLRWTYVAVGGIGLSFYIYRELFARFFQSLHDYQITAMRKVTEGIGEITLRPIGQPIHFTAGQFVTVHIEAKDGWHRHPFTISSAPHEEAIRITIKAIGDYTSRLPELLSVGMPAVIDGPHGRFTHLRGTDHQLWIAGGVGVTPFLSWLRALDGELRQHVTFFYANDGPTPFADEIRQIAQRQIRLHAHIIDTSVVPRLTTQEVLAAASTDPRELSVFICGPEGMVRTFQRELTKAGVLARHTHREYFDWR